MSTTLNDAVCHPNLQFVIEAVPHTAASDFISTQSAHGSAFFVTAVPASEAALLSDERGLATSRAKITGGCCWMKFSIARDDILCGLASSSSASLPITVSSQRLKARAIPSGMDLHSLGAEPAKPRSADVFKLIDDFSQSFFSRHWRWQAQYRGREVFRWLRRLLPDPSRPFRAARRPQMVLSDFHWRN